MPTGRSRPDGISVSLACNLFLDRGIEPTAGGFDERGRLRRSPPARLVLVSRTPFRQNRIDNSPCFFDIILTRETSRISSYGVEQKFLISPHFRGIGLLADH